MAQLDKVGVVLHDERGWTTGACIGPQYPVVASLVTGSFIVRLSTLMGSLVDFTEYLASISLAFLFVASLINEASRLSLRISRRHAVPRPACDAPIELLLRLD